jgi:hypothetical protein
MTKVKTKTAPRIAALEDDLKQRDERIKELRAVNPGLVKSVIRLAGMICPTRQSAIGDRALPATLLGACRPRRGGCGQKPPRHPGAGRSVTAIGYRAFFGLRKHLTRLSFKKITCEADCLYNDYVALYSPPPAVPVPDFICRSRTRVR